MQIDKFKAFLLIIGYRVNTAGDVTKCSSVQESRVSQAATHSCNQYAITVTLPVEIVLRRRMLTCPENTDVPKRYSYVFTTLTMITER